MTVAGTVGVLDEARRDGLGDADIASVIGVLGGDVQRSRQFSQPDDMLEEP